MNTYRIIENETVFKKFVTEYLNRFDSNCYSFMTRDNSNEIYIRFTDARIGEILSIKYTLIPCDAPDLYLHDGWTHGGNPHLFNI
jgi:hypothetical protein